ncbi:hypothetical protein I547_4242 [Mycobacterium kansasii 824]|uniref:Uncharacterized protein n=1 Tax=Mycobacterium kansasii TaxID=1768 RepID=A0A1V3XNA7_MYCKA|nr:hypothetical protein I547_4242 [Mycobacterium kansasii 824]OOK78517.1 hypothetical protein BZL30_1795 [Mycobacterium kansasii]OOK80246.1 hypothetical protein BZL29_1853 [Mycobacterium kansasii]
MNVAGPASNTRMKTSTSATIAIRWGAACQAVIQHGAECARPSGSEQDHHKPGRSDPST